MSSDRKNTRALGYPEKIPREHGSAACTAACSQGKVKVSAVHMVFMGNSVTYSALTAASAAAIVWASQYVHSHILPAFSTVTAALNGIG